MRTLCKLIVIFILLVPSGALAADAGLVVKSVRYFSYPTFTRIVFELDASMPYVLSKTADKKALVFTSYNMPCTIKAPLPRIKDGVVRGLELSQDSGRSAIIIHLDAAAGEAKDFVLRAPDRIVLDITRGATPVSQPLDDKAITIMLDPGHGGKDLGVVTAHGQEKTFTLDIALAVRKLLQANPRIKVLVTRVKDQALSLDERAAIANASGAAMLVSIHGTVAPHAAVYLQDLMEEPSAQPTSRASNDFLAFESGSEQEQLRWGRQQASHTRWSSGLGRSMARSVSGKNTAEPLQAPLAGLAAVDAAAVLVELSMTADRSKAAEAVAEGIGQYVRESR